LAEAGTDVVISAPTETQPKTADDHNTAGLKTTAMRLVNAIPAVIEAPPGLLTTLDLPLITGRGLVI
jgi:4-hydroxy-tetrahydrodipicolinate reductase